MPTTDSYRVEINGDWTLKDLHEFPYAYNQAYSFLYSLTEVDPEYDERLEITYRSHPWTGGYSAVNFYNYLYYLIPSKERPQLLAFSYSSPGWIELGLVLGVAMSLKRIISQLSQSAREINSVYQEIYKGMQERKLLKVEVKSAKLKLDREHLQFIEESAKTFSKILGFKNLKELNDLAPNRLAAMKMLLSFYRRVRNLQKYEDQNKLKF